MSYARNLSIAIEGKNVAEAQEFAEQAFARITDPSEWEVQHVLFEYAGARVKCTINAYQHSEEDARMIRERELAAGEGGWPHLEDPGFHDEP